MIGKLCIAATLCAGLATAQSNQVVPPSKPLAFEVVSIRQNVAGGEIEKFGATPDGFHMVNMPLGRVILTAYTPAGDLL
jgi:hypothetical protein